MLFKLFCHECRQNLPKRFRSFNEFVFKDDLVAVASVFSPFRLIGLTRLIGLKLDS